MLSKKFLVKLLIPVVSFSLLSSQSLILATPSENNIIPATSSRIHYTGRSYQSGENVVSICWPGTSLEIKFQGTSVGLYLENVPNEYPDANYINVFIDGVELKPIRCDKDKNYILLKEGLKDTVHTLQIFKRTDSNAGPINFKGIALDEGKQLIDPQIKNDGLKIEFYGDSILSGTAVEAPTYLEYTDEQLKDMKLEREPFSTFDTWNNYIAFPVTNWQVDFTLDEAESIAKLWNGKFKTASKTVTVTNEDYNATIPAGGTINFGATINHNGELSLKDLKCNMQ